jgi:secondary thiamine-phosphate synthase enzyme
MDRFAIRSKNKNEFINIDAEIKTIIDNKNYKDGSLLIFTPHTTAGITINENADPDVPRDIINALNKIVPETGHRHIEGNSPAHIKSSMIGCSEQVILENGKIKLGTWQSVFFCEFDGPRQREVWIKLLPEQK